MEGNKRQKYFQVRKEMHSVSVVISLQFILQILHLEQDFQGFPKKELPVRNLFLHQYQFLDLFGLFILLAEAERIYFIARRATAC